MTTTTKVVVRYRNLIGQRYLAIVDEDPGGRPLRKSELIPVQRTEPALNLTTLFNGFKPLLSGLDPQDVNKLSYELVQALQGEGGTVDDLFRQVGSLTNGLADRDKLIGDVIDNIDATIGPVAARDAHLSGLITNLQRFVTGLSSEMAPRPIGASFLVVLAALLVLSFNVDKLPFTSGSGYSAAFPHAQGLRKGDRVMIGGVVVGKVTSVSLEGTHVRIGFSVG